MVVGAGVVVVGEGVVVGDGVVVYFMHEQQSFPISRTCLGSL